MSNTATETLSVVVEREIPFPPEKIWRALTQPHLIEEWLMKNDFKPVVGHSFNLRADWGAVDCRVLSVEPNKDAVLHLGCLWARERDHLDPHTHGHGDTPAHGTGRLPAGSAAGLSGRQVRVAEIPCGAGGGPGADGLNFAKWRE